jgi:hypothetical protein
MATLDLNFTGLTWLKDWWGKIKTNIVNINTQLENHINNHPSGGGGGVYVNIKEAPYNAPSNGQDITTTLQTAIDVVSLAGGGTIYFPAGTYFHDYIDLKENVRLFSDQGAVLKTVYPYNGAENPASIEMHPGSVLEGITHDCGIDWDNNGLDGCLIEVSTNGSKIINCFFQNVADYGVIVSGEKSEIIGCKFETFNYIGDIPQAGGILIYNSCLIDNCFLNCLQGVRYNGSTNPYINVDIRNCKFASYLELFDVNEIGNVANFNIYNNYFHNSNYLNIVSVKNVNVYNNYFAFYPTLYINNFLVNISGYCENIKVYNNRFNGDCDDIEALSPERSCIIVDVTDVNINNIQIYGNEFYSQESPDTRYSILLTSELDMQYMDSSKPPIKICNNYFNNNQEFPVMVRGAVFKGLEFYENTINSSHESAWQIEFDSNYGVPEKCLIHNNGGSFESKIRVIDINSTNYGFYAFVAKEGNVGIIQDQGAPQTCFVPVGTIYKNTNNSVGQVHQYVCLDMDNITKINTWGKLSTIQSL